ncbi:MAG: DNA polymerase III subunit beta [Planctomycetota bacterium]
MKAICDRGALMDALGLIGGVVVARTPKPVLACVKLVAEDGKLTLSATDLDVAINLSTARVEVQEPGEALVPADKFQSIVRESIDPTLALETDQNQTTITGQDSKFILHGHAPGEFPQPPAFEGDADFEVAASDLHRLIAMTIFATAKENSRYAINGVLVEREGKNLAVVATDGHRLAVARGLCVKANDEKRNAIVPTKALHLLMRLFDDGDQSVRVRVADNQVLFAADHAVLSSNLVEGNFPPYRDVIPKDGDRKATLETDRFISAVRRAALLTNEESKGVRMGFSEDGLTISSRAPEMGEAEINVEMPEFTGEAMEIGFNPAYLLDALKVVDQDKVQLDMKGSAKPGVLKTGNDFLYVVMPVNLQ